MSDDRNRLKEIEEMSDAERKTLVDKLDRFFAHITPKCDHKFSGWREFDDGNGGEQVCAKCGIGAMADSLRNGL